MEPTPAHWVDGRPVPVPASRPGENPVTGGSGTAIALGTARIMHEEYLETKTVVVAL